MNSGLVYESTNMTATHFQALLFNHQWKNKKYLERVMWSATYESSVQYSRMNSGLVYASTNMAATGLFPGITYIIQPSMEKQDVQSHKPTHKKINLG